MSTSYRSSNSPIAWHYTVGLHWPSIVREGAIRLATLHVPVGERPAVWFTTSTSYESTARKGHRTLGLLSVLDTALMCGGLYRIGVALDETVELGAYLRKSGIKAGAYRRLVASAVQMGTPNPEACWRVSFAPLAASKWISVQRSFDGVVWTDVQRAGSSPTASP